MKDESPSNASETASVRETGEKKSVLRPGESAGLLACFEKGLVPFKAEQGKHWRWNSHSGEPEITDGEAPEGVPRNFEEAERICYPGSSAPETFVCWLCKKEKARPPVWVSDAVSGKFEYCAECWQTDAELRRQQEAQTPKAPPASIHPEVVRAFGEIAREGNGPRRPLFKAPCQKCSAAEWSVELDGELLCDECWRAQLQANRKPTGMNNRGMAERMSFARFEQYDFEAEARFAIPDEMQIPAVCNCGKKICTFEGFWRHSDKSDADDHVIGPKQAPDLFTAMAIGAVTLGARGQLPRVTPSRDGDGIGSEGTELRGTCSSSQSCTGGHLYGRFVRGVVVENPLVPVTCKFCGQRDETSAPKKPCPLPPPGWSCTRPAGHEGPCAAEFTGTPREPAGWTISKSPAEVAQEEWDRIVGYDRSIHSNSSAQAWAQFFVRCVTELDRRHMATNSAADFSPHLDTDYMTGWFANAMMAIHDVTVRRYEDQVRTLATNNEELMAMVEKATESRQLVWGIALALLCGCFFVGLVIYGLTRFFGV